MAAATTNQTIEAQSKGVLVGGLVAASTTLYQGCMSFLASGFLTGTAGGNAFAGVNKNYVDYSAGSAGDKSAENFTEGVFYLSGSGFSQASVGVKAYATDNNTVSVTSSSNSLVGTIVEYVSSTKVGIKIDVQLA